MSTIATRQGRSNRSRWYYARLLLRSNLARRKSQAAVIPAITRIAILRSLPLVPVTVESTATANAITNSAIQARTRIPQSGLVVERMCQTMASAKLAAPTGAAMIAIRTFKVASFLAPEVCHRTRKGALRRPLLYSAFGSGFEIAIVSPASPTLNRAKRLTEMFSPSLPILVAMTCEIEMVWSLMKGCSYRQTSP